MTPEAFSWLQRSRISISTVVDNRSEGIEVESNVRFGRLPYRVEIDGTPFEVGRYRTSLARPVDAQATPDEGGAAIRTWLCLPRPRNSDRDATRPMRRAAKLDANHPAIVEALLSVSGVTLHSLAGVSNGCPDLLVARGGSRIWSK